MHTTDAPTLGHNNPPEAMTFEAVAAKVEADISTSMTEGFNRAAALVAKELPASIADQAQLDAISEDAVSLRKARQWIIAKQREATDPVTALANRVRNLFKGPLEDVQKREASITALITAYNRRIADEKREAAEKAAKAAREEQERLFNQADLALDTGLDAAAEGLAKSGEQVGKQAVKLEKLAAGSTADLARTSTMAGTVSSKLEWHSEITDMKALRKGLGKLGDHFTTPEIEKAIRAFRAAEVKAGRGELLLDAEKPALKGVRFWQEDKAFVR